MRELTSAQVCSNLMLDAIGNLIITRHFGNKYRSYTGYWTKIIISGLIAFCIRI